MPYPVCKGTSLGRPVRDVPTEGPWEVPGTSRSGLLDGKSLGRVRKLCRIIVDLIASVSLPVSLLLIIYARKLCSKAHLCGLIVQFQSN